MTLAVNDTLEMYRGDAVTWEFTLTDDGVAVNITGATIRFTVRKAYPAGTIVSDSDAVLTSTTTDNISLTNPTSGVFEVDVTPAQTYDLDYTTIKKWVYGVELQLSGSTDSETVASGVFKLYPDTVRAA